MIVIDINCDMGESWNDQKIGNDKAMFPLISSCNIGCGMHGGDPLTIEETIQHAIDYNLNIGAHPSYPDREGFGRTKIVISPKELKASIKYQVAALKGMTESKGAKLKFVKPHGALYNSMATDKNESEIVIDAILEIDKNLSLMGMAGSEMEDVAKSKNIAFIPEAFIDRMYNSKGSLVSRKYKNASITDPDEAIKQALSIIKNGNVHTIDGSLININANTLCIHGDNPSAVEIGRRVAYEFEKVGIKIQPFK